MLMNHRALIGVRRPHFVFVTFVDEIFAATVEESKVFLARCLYNSVPRIFLGIVGQDHSDSKSSRFCFNHLRYIL